MNSIQGLKVSITKTNQSIHNSFGFHLENDPLLFFSEIPPAIPAMFSTNTSRNSQKLPNVPCISSGIIPEQIPIKRSPGIPFRTSTTNSYQKRCKKCARKFSMNCFRNSSMIFFYIFSFHEFFFRNSSIPSGDFPLNHPRIPSEILQNPSDSKSS